MHKINCKEKTETTASGNKGFSLIEMTVVLLIVALLIGGVLLGRNLISSASMKDLMTDIDYYSTATKTFQDRYNALPGDYVTASSTWGALDGSTGSTAGCYTTAAVPSKTATCNGDGNGRLDQWYERFLFFRHLSTARLIKGSYTGTGDPAGGQNPSVNNIPKSVVEGVFISASYLDINSNAGDAYFEGSYGNLFIIGGIGAFNADRGALTPADAQEIDNKMDDAKPGTGIVRSFTTKNTSPTRFCATTSDASTAEYILTNTDKVCSLIYIPGF